MFKSVPRQKLETAIAQASDPELIAKLTGELNRLTLAEDRRRARRRRKQKAAADTWPPAINLDAVISLPDTPAVAVPSARRSAQDVLSGTQTAPASQGALISQPNAKKPAPERPKSLDSSSRVIHSMCPPGVQDSPSCGPGRLPSTGYERVTSLPWCEADGFSFAVRDEYGNVQMTNERLEREKRER